MPDQSAPIYQAGTVVDTLDLSTADWQPSVPTDAATGRPLDGREVAQVAVVVHRGHTYIALRNSLRPEDVCTFTETE